MEHCSILHFMYLFNTICTTVMLKCTLFYILLVITSDDMYFIHNFINIIIVYNILSLRRNSKN